jgi:hypothetical protein
VHHPTPRALTALALAAAGASAAAAPAGAATRVTAADAAARACHVKLAPGAKGTDQTRYTATETGLVTARLKGAGDWDLGVFDARTGRRVAGSAGPRSSELAEGFVRAGQRLVVQACRFRGAASAASLTVSVAALPKTLKQQGTAKVVDVDTRDRAAKRRLQALGLDLTEHGDADSVEVVTYGTADENKLKAAGFTYNVRIADLRARTKRNQEADAKYAASVARSDLPSGRDSYRFLEDYNLEMKQLAQRYPNMVRLFTLPERTIEGREVLGIEIARNAQDTEDGKPLFLMLGVHHAREWPSSEHAMEWAYDLLTNFGRQARTTRLVEATRNVVVPIVNPDGFNISRNAAPQGDFGLFDYEMKRKNCRISANTPDVFRSGTCDDNPAGRLRGTDPNRNYGGFWGGPGASTAWSSDTYRGDGPFSEPETRNIKAFVGTRQVTALITNHTYSNLVLRPPGIYEVGFPVDEPLMRELGARMTSRNAYANNPSFTLYDTTGGTEDWTYWTAGALGYTYEIGPDEFHPPFENGVIAEYLGRAPAAGAGKGGNREAYYEALETVASPVSHVRVTGKAPAGHRLRVAKTFTTSTSPVVNADGTTGAPQTFADSLSGTFRPTRGNGFTWAINPSTRPVVAGRVGREPTGPQQAPITLINPAGVPGVGKVETTTFTVQPGNFDNGSAVLEFSWPDPTPSDTEDQDWDFYVIGPDGKTEVASAATLANPEKARIIAPAPGTYTVIVDNYAGGTASTDWAGKVTFEPPLPSTTGKVEAWTLTCEKPDGRVVSSRQLVAMRGERIDVGKVCQPKRGRKK